MESGWLDVADLNERVQTRLTELGVLSQVGDDPDPNWPRRYLLVASWRKRWERHQPDPDSSLGECEWCSNYCGDPYRENPVEWPCPDALSVLREIGVEP
jgi:hypothetical protein